MDSRTHIRIAGDLHHQEHDRGYLMCSQVLKLWRQFAHSKDRPQSCFQVGDLIDGYELPDETNRRDLLAAVAELKSSPMPVHAIVGNHETYWLPDRAFHLKALELDSISRVIDAGPLSVILFDVTVDNESFGELTADRARWLSDVVNADARPAIVIQHQLIHASEVVCGHRHYVRNSGDYRKLLQRLPQIKLLVTGHRHIPALTMIGSIPQVTLGAFCSFPFTFAEISIDSANEKGVFRELPLESTFDPGEIPEFQELLKHSQRLIIEHAPEVWTGRPRMTPELREISLSWGS